MSNYKNNKKVMDAGRRAIREVVRREGVSEAEVRAEMEFSIREAYDLNNPLWEKLSLHGRSADPRGVHSLDGRFGEKGNV